MGGLALDQHAIEAGPAQPPWWLSVTVPVRGDLVTMAMRPLILASVPVRGPFIKQSRFSGLRGSTWGPFSSM
jgi:hypothetical protein